MLVRQLVSNEFRIPTGLRRCPKHDQFLLGGSPVGELSGWGLGAGPVVANGKKGPNKSASVRISGLFDKPVRTSSHDSFEIDNPSVSDVGTTFAVLGMSPAQLGFVRRKLG
jgi:hypothetical protein